MNELADRPLRVPGESLWLHSWRLLRWFGNLRLAPRWREEKSGLVLRALRRYFFDGLTRPGKILFVCSLLTFLFSYQSESHLFLATAALGFSLIAWSLLIGYLFRPGLSATRHGAPVAYAGQPFESRFTLHNRRRCSLHNFTIREQVVPFGQWPTEWQRLHVLKLGRGEQLTVPVSFVPMRRGKYELTGIAVQSYFPFFLNRFTQQIRAPGELYVLPEPLQATVPSLRQVADLASKRLRLGSDASKKGPSLEYSHSRPYETGDSLRRLDHRASSRLSTAMSKIYQGAEELRRDQVHLIVDLSLQNFQRWQRRPKESDTLDRRLALAVEIGLSARNEGFSLAAIATGSQWHALDDERLFDRLIACCEAEKAADQSLDPSHRTLPEAPLDDKGLQVLVLGHWSAAAAELVDRWHRKGVLCLVFLLPERAEDAETLPSGSQFVEIAQEENQQTYSPAANLGLSRLLTSIANGGKQ